MTTFSHCLNHTSFITQCCYIYSTYKQMYPISKVNLSYYTIVILMKALYSNPIITLRYSQLHPPFNSTLACGYILRKSLEKHATATQMSTRLLCTVQYGQWRKALSRRPGRASDLGWSVLLPPRVTTLNNLMSLNVSISLCYKSDLISLQIKLL